jgi:hypothetical protein
MANDAPAGKRGRPPVEAPKPGAIVSVWLPPADADKIIQIAHARELTVSALVRSWLQLKIKSS